MRAVIESSFLSHAGVTRNAEHGWACNDLNEATHAGSSPADSPLL